MGLFSYFANALSEPKGPVYSIGDLKEHWNAYRKGVIIISDSMKNMLSERSVSSITRSFDGKSGIGSTSSRIRFVYLNTIRSWIEDEFIPKIERFSGHYEMKANDKRQQWCTKSPGDYGSPSCNIRNNLEVIRERGTNIVDALHFFICDERSSFDMRRSLENEEFTDSSARRWYIDGKHIVQDNMDRIEREVSGLIERT